MICQENTPLVILYTLLLMLLIILPTPAIRSYQITDLCPTSHLNRLIYFRPWRRIWGGCWNQPYLPSGTPWEGMSWGGHAITAYIIESTGYYVSCCIPPNWLFHQRTGTWWWMTCQKIPHWCQYHIPSEIRGLKLGWGRRWLSTNMGFPWLCWIRWVEPTLVSCPM